MVYTKIVGWLVFLAGLILIAWTLYQSYAIFTAKVSVPAFFAAQEQTVAPTGGTLDIQEQLKQMVGEQLKGFLPTGAITDFLNLGVWSILAGLLMFGGAQLAGLGIKLIK
jgi:sulfite exporter TauE/SafE